MDHRPPNQRLGEKCGLGDIDCILIPELETNFGTRDLLKEIYADYLRDQFTQTKQTALWTVLARKGHETAAQ